MRETEIRALVSDEPSVIRSLERVGFEFSSESEQLDIILDRPDAALFREGRKIRIRIENSRAELTYKGQFEEGRGSSRRLEVSCSFKVSEVDRLISIFSEIGFPPCFQIPKRRLAFRRGDLRVTLDSWPIIGNIMEIEGEENEAHKLASEVLPLVEFRNYRLKELLKVKERTSGRNLQSLQAEWEQQNNKELGRLELLFR